MNAPIQHQQMSTLLASVATVAKVSATSLGLARTDKSAGALSARDHNAKSGIARVTVSRLAGAEDRIKEIRVTQEVGRDVMMRYTTAWGDRRLLPNVNVEKFLQEWTRAKADFTNLVGKFADDAPQLIEQAQVNIGNFDVTVPTVEEVRNAFSLEFALEAIPDASKFSASNLDKAVEGALKQRFENDIAAAYQLAQKDALKRLAEPLQNLVERMTAFSKREEEKSRGIAVGKEGFFRDAVIENVQEIGKVFGSFNLAGDPQIDAIAQALDQFDGIEANDLRSSKDLREDTRKRAAAILEKLGDWL